MRGRIRRGLLCGGLVLVGIALHAGAVWQLDTIGKAKLWDEQIEHSAKLALGLPGGKKR